MRAASAERKAAIVGSDRDPLMFLVDTVFDETIDRSEQDGCGRYLPAVFAPETVGDAGAVNSHRDAD